MAVIMVLGIFLLFLQTATGGEMVKDIDRDVAPVSPDMKPLTSSQGVIGAPEGSPAVASSAPGQTPDYLVSPGVFLYAGFITPEPRGDGIIFQNDFQRVELASNEAVYLDIGSRQNVAKGSKFLVFRKSRFVYHPAEQSLSLTKSSSEEVPGHLMPEGGFLDDGGYFLKHGRPMGFLIRVVGVAEVVDAGENESRAIIVDSFEPMRNGDSVMAYKEQTPPLIDAGKDKTGGKALEGYIVASKYPPSSLGKFDILYIDKGSDHDVSPGDRFEVYVAPEYDENRKWAFDRKKLPTLTHRIGELRALATQKETSTVLVVESSKEMKVGDRIRSIRSRP
ncbi:MAG: hypothetical protein HY579_06985 [Nitrospinae bacterium]|nr:hypothetical protein [Nitrospinota bacterium]